MRVTNSGRKKIIADVDEIVGNIILEVEENRYEPSERGAGTAVTDEGVDVVTGLVLGLIERSSGLQPGTLTASKGAPEILEEIQGGEDVRDFDELEEFDSFVRDNGEDKYRYVNTVYRHKLTGRFICVEEQRSGDIVGTTTAEFTTREETVSYEWV